jgi:NAD(P)-dependent dehydrogenase (short-subunit alcohol dehydrogenase family)
VFVPRKLSESGKRETKYFASKSKSEQFIKGFKTERREHGKAAVSAEERHWIQVARTELGNLDALREVLDHWKKTGRGVRPISATDSVESYIQFRESRKLNAATKHDVTWRLRAFAGEFGSEQLNTITPGAIETYLNKHAEGWSRKSHHKRLLQFFSHAKRHRWIADNPFDELVAPETPGGKRDVYTPKQFSDLLQNSVFSDVEVCLFIALSGLAFFRSQELVRRFDGEQVIEWTDFLWDRDLIHVREGVAKSTRRKSGNERFTPIHSALTEWLRPITKDRKGRVINCSVRSFRKRLHKVFKKAEVPFIDNGLRKSAISYWLSAHPEFGVAQVSQWAGNSEASCRQHYLKILTKEQGAEWFKNAEWLATIVGGAIPV